MTVYEIVDKLAKEKAVETIINNITEGVAFDPTALSDLAQDIYLSLLTKGEKLVEVWEQGHINFYLSRIACNNIKSSSSPYYRNYIKQQKLKIPITDKIMNTSGE